MPVSGVRLWMMAGAMAALLLPGAAQADPDSYVDIVRGRALAIAGDCVACHTAPGGQPFAGGLGLATPFGTILTANITPDDATGIGRWSANDFATAMQQGLRPGGGHLYPAFPYPYYTKMPRADVDAVYAYLRTLPPVTKMVDRNSLPFPFSIRTSMMAWNALFFTPGVFVPDPARSEEFNRGAYLVEGPGHCGACHTPMNALGGSRNSVFLQGNQIDDWTAPNITNAPRIGLGGWSADDIVTYLRTGQNAHSIASGPMAEVVADSTALMPTADLHAMAVYLKERGAAGSESPPAALASSDSRMSTGEAIYIDTCAACHTRAGAGIEHIFPRLAGSAVVQQDDPTTLVRIVLTGVRGAVTASAPTGPAMPSLGYRLDDSQVAAVLTYIRNSWGNAALPVAAADVGKTRSKVAGIP
jgi:mono/diheme cytochrome c family protein